MSPLHKTNPDHMNMDESDDTRRSFDQFDICNELSHLDETKTSQLQSLNGPRLGNNYKRCRIMPYPSGAENYNTLRTREEKMHSLESDIVTIFGRSLTDDSSKNSDNTCGGIKKYSHERTRSLYHNYGDFRSPGK